MEVSQNNWFLQSHASADRSEHIIESIAEILAVVLQKMCSGKGKADELYTNPSIRHMSFRKGPPESPKMDVSHHYRHWNSGGKTRSPLSKMNQEYIESVAKGGIERTKSASKLSKSLSNPFIREEFRALGGSKSFSDLIDEEVIAGEKSPVLARLQKAKTAYSFMRSDSLDFS